MSDILEILRRGAGPKDVDRAADEITRLRAENERLREALSYYAEENYNGYNGNGACARAALEGVTEPANTQTGER